jgi:hypothetical protein
MKRTLIIAAGAAALLTLVSGCATDQSGSTSAQTAMPPAEIAATGVPPLPEGVVLRQDMDIQGIWLAPGFNFQGYDMLLIEDSEFRAKVRSNEQAMRSAMTFAT